MRSSLAAFLLTALAVPVLASCTAGDGADGDAASSPRTGTVPSEDGPAASDAPRPTTTDVVLSYAGWEKGSDAVEAAGYVSPVVEDGGTCTLEVTGDGRTRSASVPAIADATTTVCSGLSIPGAELAPGTWTVRLQYSSATTEGTSQPLDVEVPA
ncbi:hypothetical protein GCU60_19630 [Blastococcus saxobsidens]|uniref:Lipoprotein n=1 Tax=Blastococcus saxobsidens TaxID=138336 RepID=A0A6L9W8S9_9ACTN|nr:hypothetical protein [Blastococcus saxobsidens]NEK87954.1 hypothetical protein [Blastococcus saxobsidens]